MPYAAIADPTRRKILRLLRAGSLTAGEIAERFQLTKPTLSHHFRVLRAAGLIRAERRGTSIVYTLQSNVLEDLAAELLELVPEFTHQKEIVLKKFWMVSAGATVLAFAASLAVYAWLPDPMPVHFDIHGHADGFGSRAVGAFLLPCVMLALLAFARVRSRQLDGVGAMTGVLASFLLALHVLVLRAALHDGELGDLFWVLVGVMFVVLGMILPRLRLNRWFGVRTPWSMRSPEAWARTHRAAGRVMVVCGAALALSSSIAVRVIAIGVLVVVPVAQSWWIARKLGAS